MLRLFLTALFMSFPLVATAYSYECVFRDQGRNRVIPPSVEIDVAADGRSATVWDRVIERHVGEPLRARFFEDTNAIMRVRWRIEDAIGSGGAKATLDYRIVFRKNRTRARVYFSAVGYDNTDQGEGICTLKQ